MQPNKAQPFMHAPFTSYRGAECVLVVVLLIAEKIKHADLRK